MTPMNGIRIDDLRQQQRELASRASTSAELARGTGRRARSVRLGRFRPWASVETLLDRSLGRRALPSI